MKMQELASPCEGKDSGLSQTTMSVLLLVVVRVVRVRWDLNFLIALVAYCMVFCGSSVMYAKNSAPYLVGDMNVESTLGSAILLSA